MNSGYEKNMKPVRQCITLVLILIIQTHYRYPIVTITGTYYYYSGIYMYYERIAIFDWCPSQTHSGQNTYSTLEHSSQFSTHGSILSSGHHSVTSMADRVEHDPAYSCLDSVSLLCIVHVIGFIALDKSLPPSYLSFSDLSLSIPQQQNGDNVCKSLDSSSHFPPQDSLHHSGQHSGSCTASPVQPVPTYAHLNMVGQIQCFF